MPSGPAALLAVAPRSSGSPGTAASPAGLRAAGVCLARLSGERLGSGIASLSMNRLAAADVTSGR